MFRHKRWVQIREKREGLAAARGGSRQTHGPDALSPLEPLPRNAKRGAPDESGAPLLLTLQAMQR